VQLLAGVAVVVAVVVVVVESIELAIDPSNCLWLMSVDPSAMGASFKSTVRANKSFVESRREAAK